MKTFTGWLTAIVFLISGCTFNVDVLTPEPPQPTPLPTGGIPSPVATISATADPISPTPSPTPTAPVFYGVVFIPDSPISQNGRIFPAGTKQVFAVWNYLNMRAGMTVKREWYLNGQLWLTREEAWDFAKYGENGATQQDISIYDFDAGLSTGIYELRLYIDNVIQAVGTSPNGQPDTKATFEIRSNDEAQAGSVSPDFQWAVEVFGEQRIVLEDKYRNPTMVYTAREVPYISWFNDSRHFLFVDRDRSGQKPGTTIGIRDDLWLVDVPSLAMHLLYKSDTSFNGRSGPVASPDGKYIASLEGSGYGDACLIDSRLIFFEVAGDLNSVKAIEQGEFSGLPAFNESWIYPVEDGFWQNGDSYLVTLDGTCNADKGKLGPYTFDMLNRTAAQSSSTQQPIPGNLGLGIVHGKIVDAITNAPIANVAVTCEQHSYTSSPPCSGTVLTNADGTYAFNNVFFHDTDTIKLTVQAAGYEPQQISRSAFTINDWEANASLNRKP